MAPRVSPPTPLCSPTALMTQDNAGKPDQKHPWHGHSQVECSCGTSEPAIGPKRVGFYPPLSGSEPESMLAAPCSLSKPAQPESAPSGQCNVCRSGRELSLHWEAQEAKESSKVPHSKGGPVPWSQGVLQSQDLGSEMPRTLLNSVSVQ